MNHLRPSSDHVAPAQDQIYLPGVGMSEETLLFGKAGPEPQGTKFHHDIAVSIAAFPHSTHF